jgi:sugar/nucleoside kinase (ribokinase family)
MPVTVPPFDILCVADISVDLILRGNVRPRFGQFEQRIDDYTLELGGSACIFASQFVRLGGAAGVIGVVGDDPFGDIVLARLQAIGVDVARLRRDPSVRTGLGVALAEPDDRAILTYVGTIDAVLPEVLTDEVALSCRHWHVASYFLLTRLRDHWPGWLGQLREAGWTISLDTNWDPDASWEGVAELLPLVDVFLPNQAEALAISGMTDVVAAGRALAARGPLVVIKRGELGALAFKDDQHWEAPALLVAPTAIVDTIGAGDCFDAGFLRAWLLSKPIEHCLELANRCGAASLTAAGGIEAQLYEEIV